MNRNLLVLVGLVSCLPLAFTVGCGDDTSGGGGSGAGSTGGNGGGGGTSDGGGGGTSDGGGGGTSDGGGGGTPGPATCASYCATITSACTAGNAQWGTAASCELACAAFTAGTPGDISGDTLECRAYHAGVASTTQPEVHCVHAGPLGGGVTAGDGCGTSRCDSFCRIATEVCTGEANYPFTSEDDCQTQCMAYTDGDDFSTADTSGNDLQCRMYHLTAAAAEADGSRTHCAHVAGSLCMN